MEKKRSLGITLCNLTNALKRRTDERVTRCVTCVSTRTQGWIIGYLADHENEDIFQRDIEAKMGIRRSTATGILKLMEKNGLITREPVDYDARLKKLVLTPLAMEAHKAISSAIEQNERDILSCLTSEEQEAFFAIADKLITCLNSSGKPDSHDCPACEKNR